MSYAFDKTKSYRAQCLNVVDGDTADFLVDLGFHQYMKARFRFSRINTPELSSTDPAVRAKAMEARNFVFSAILRDPNTKSFDEKISWTCRLVAEKDPDNYGRWLAEVFYQPWTNGKQLPEVSLNQQLLDAGLAVLYKS